jgi:DNA topoisomerase-2
VSFVADKIAKSLAKAIEKKNKGGTKISNNQIKNHLCIFVNALVENPTFDSQTKDHLTNRKNCYKDECELSDKFLKAACSAKGEILDSILSFAMFKAKKEMKKIGGTKRIKLTGIQKVSTGTINPFSFYFFAWTISYHMVYQIMSYRIFLSVSSL